MHEIISHGQGKLSGAHEIISAAQEKPHGVILTMVAREEEEIFIFLKSQRNIPNNVIKRLMVQMGLCPVNRLQDFQICFKYLSETI